MKHSSNVVSLFLVDQSGQFLHSLSLVQCSEHVYRVHASQYISSIRLFDTSFAKVIAVMAHNPSLFFLGFARISLRALTFEHPLAQRLQRRQAVEKNVARLTEIFKQTSCDRGKEKNAIIAVFSPHNLTRTLPKTIDSTIECAIEVPFLPVPSVDCLHGLHRVLAARKIFDEEDDWWLVRLYSFSTSKLRA
jgi:hypothetical protein